MRFSSYGRRELSIAWISAMITVAVSYLTAYFYDFSLGLTLGAVAIVLWLCFILFFRDPERTINPEPDSLLSPADGCIADIELISNSPENEFFEGANAIRIGIFLSVFDVHINRAPCDLEVTAKLYREGKYFDARRSEAASLNEAMTIACKAESSCGTFPLLVRQISGAIAKRIICTAEPGTKLSRGERYGMIKFGSRTELYIPARQNFEVKVKVGNKVNAGLSVLVKIKNRQEDTK